jgi:hypothetical protein
VALAQPQRIDQQTPGAPMIRESRDQGSRPFDGLGIVPAGLYQPLYGFELCRLGRWGLGGAFWVASSPWQSFANSSWDK